MSDDNCPPTAAEGQWAVLHVAYHHEKVRLRGTGHGDGGQDGPATSFGSKNSLPSGLSSILTEPHLSQSLDRVDTLLECQEVQLLSLHSAPTPAPPVCLQARQCWRPEKRRLCQ